MPLSSKACFAFSLAHGCPPSNTVHIPCRSGVLQGMAEGWQQEDAPSRKPSQRCCGSPRALGSTQTTCNARRVPVTSSSLISEIISNENTIPVDVARRLYYPFLAKKFLFRYAFLKLNKSKVNGLDLFLSSLYIIIYYILIK